LRTSGVDWLTAADAGLPVNCGFCSARKTANEKRSFDFAPNSASLRISA
jgi:hypothetical protein